MYSEKMTSSEKRAVISLSAIMGLRMVGLFMVLPVFVLYAHQLQDATPLLIGVAMGIYGLFQALLQIPFGALSDRIGRKPIILIGLLLFTAGSILSGLAHHLSLLILGRALQGAGAIGGTVLALLADLTREEQRTKSMAIAGITIGFSFSLAMILGPLLAAYFSVNYLFFLAALFSLIAIGILYIKTPTPLTLRWQRDTEPELQAFFKLLKVPQLILLNIGIFILHALFTASFMVIPLQLAKQLSIPVTHQWLVYLPALLLALLISFICMGKAERQQQIKTFFLFGIFLLISGESLLWLSNRYFIGTGLGLSLFLTGFTLLEAFLPSLISRTAPTERKGSALGIYSCAQFFGIFIGGIIGGYLSGKFDFAAVYIFCIIFAVLWLALACFMRPLPALVTEVWRLTSPQHNWSEMAAKLRVIPGILDVTFITEDGIAYLKMERAALLHPDFIRMKEQINGSKVY